MLPTGCICFLGLLSTFELSHTCTYSHVLCRVLKNFSVLTYSAQNLFIISYKRKMLFSVLIISLKLFELKIQFYKSRFWIHSLYLYAWSIFNLYNWLEVTSQATLIILIYPLAFICTFITLISFLYLSGNLSCAIYYLHLYNVSLINFLLER